MTGRRGHTGRNPTRAQVRAEKRAEEARRLFLGALSKGASVSAAAAVAKVDRRTVYKWREKAADFAEEWDDQVEVGTDVLEDEARRRAVQGVRKPVYQGGQLVGHVQEYSDHLLTILLRGRRPEKFRERLTTTLQNPDGSSIALTPVINLTVLPRPESKGE
jgi:hypothetical protein